MSNIAIIPIDNRPVCYNLAAQISSLDRENKVFLPDISFMGTNKKPADINSILCWLEELKNIDIVIIALDTIAYGGLVSSRKSNDDFFEIKARIERLKDILSKKNARIFAFSSIMRISNNNINDEEKEYWSEYGTKIYEYSYNIHKLEKTFKTTDLISKYTKGNIPPEILKDYTETRKRNFEINKYYIELKSQGIFNTLVFSKDDCAKFGLAIGLYREGAFSIPAKVAASFKLKSAEFLPKYRFDAASMPYVPAPKYTRFKYKVKICSLENLFSSQNAINSS